MMLQEAEKSQRLSIADLGWTCKSSILSWRGIAQNDDAAKLFGEIFGSEPISVRHNKLATTSMPCRSWARGVNGGAALDLRLGVDNDRSELCLASNQNENALDASLLLLRNYATNLQSAAGVPLTSHSVFLDLELPADAASSALLEWLGPAAWQAHAILQRNEYVFELPRHRAEARVTALREMRDGIEHFGMTIEVSGASADLNLVGSPSIFDAVERVLSVPRLAEIPIVL